MHACLTRDDRIWKGPLPVDVRGFMQAPPSSCKRSQILERISEGKQVTGVAMGSMPDADDTLLDLFRVFFVQTRTPFDSNADSGG